MANDPVRVLIVNDHLGYGEALHGVGRYLLNITSAFDPARVDAVAVIFRPEPKLARLFHERDIPLRSLGRARLDPRALGDLVRIIRDERIDVVHAQGLKADTLARIAGLRTRVPVILHGRDRIADRPFLMYLLDRYLGPRTRHALAVSETVRRYLHRGRFIPEESIEVFYHGVDLQRFAPLDDAERARARAALAVAPDAPLAGTTTRLHPSKGHDDLVCAVPRVLAEFPEFRLRIANEGPTADALAKRIDELGIGHAVSLVGSQPDIRSFLGALDVLVMPSHAEGFPNSMLEGMAMGRAIVASDVDGMGEMLEDGRNALLFPVGDADAIAAALLRLLGSPDLAARLREAARSFALGLSIERTVERLTALYERVARGARAA